MGELIRLSVTSREDVDQARHAARRVAGAIGFQRVATEEVTLAVSELGSNLVRYARGGRLSVRALSDGSRRGIEVASEDDGPGICDVPLALRDGYSTGGGLGGGLGAVGRLMTEMEIESTEAGTRIVARKWLAS